MTRAERYRRIMRDRASAWRRFRAAATLDEQTAARAELLALEATRKRIALEGRPVRVWGVSCDS